MIKNLLLTIFIVLSVIFFAFYVRTRNDLDRAFWAASGWASIAGDCKAENDYLKGEIKMEYYEKAAIENLNEKGILRVVETECWSSFSRSYNRKVQELQYDR